MLRVWRWGPTAPSTFPTSGIDASGALILQPASSLPLPAMDYSDCDDGYGAGDGGPATNASFCLVSKIAVDAARNALYLADAENNRVRKVDLTNGIISDFAGQGLFGAYGFEG